MASGIKAVSPLTRALLVADEHRSPDLVRRHQARVLYPPRLAHPERRSKLPGCGELASAFSRGFERIRIPDGHVSNLSVNRASARAVSCSIQKARLASV